VLPYGDAAADPHNAARRAHVEVAGEPQPAAAPRFSRTPGPIPRAPPERGEGGADALREWGFDAAAIDRLRALGVGAAD
jgi:alpha-methylacyl-CoA racemase